jgi:Asp-tRNA(Asn)/Glu-tRNA(Gln) amidotransferase B subunit
MDALRRFSRISRTERIRNVTIRQHTGLEETIIKEIEQNQHVIVDLNRSHYPLLSVAVLS